MFLHKGRLVASQNSHPSSFISNMQQFKMFIVYHKSVKDKSIVFPNFSDQYIQDTFIHYGVNECFEKTNSGNYLLEYDLPVYDPFLQKRSFMETSAYIHIYNNKLFNNLDFVGICQYDMIHYSQYDNLQNDTIYILPMNMDPIVFNNKWTTMMFGDIINADFILRSYNSFFGKNISVENLNGLPFGVFQTGIYPVKVFKKLSSWLCVLTDELYSLHKTHPEKHWGAIGGRTERAISIFIAIELLHGMKCHFLNIRHQSGYDGKVSFQYDKNSVFNHFESDIHTKFISNGPHTKLRTYLPRVSVTDPIEFMLEDTAYVTFTCESGVSYGKRCLSISKVHDFDPIILKTNDTSEILVDKTLSPFVKNGSIYWICSYDPLTILQYDLNKEGMCSFVNNNVPTNASLGGSNLLHYKDEYWIGALQSDVTLSEEQIYKLTHIVVLDTSRWEIVYLSKPVLYNYPFSDIVKIPTTNILFNLDGKCIQSPILLTKQNGTYNIEILANSDKVHESLTFSIDFGIQVDGFTAQANLNDRMSDMAKSLAKQTRITNINS